VAWNRPWMPPGEKRPPADRKCTTPIVMMTVLWGVRAWRARKRFEEVSASKAAGSTDQPRVDISRALAVTVVTRVCTRIYDTASNVPAVASTATN
jgi:hypothetical protein